MKIFTNPQKISKYILEKKINNKKIGFIPTMGFLHEGHLSLIKLAQQKADIVAVSIYLNPIQFAPNEDLEKYPQNIKKDIELLESMGVDILFTPTNEIMYTAGFSTKISMGNITKKLCGKFRNTHFDGVTTVVAKLFNIINPDIAVFGKKDAQQLLIIKKMVKELNFNINIIEGEIIREKNGLAMSSRNKYLNTTQKNIAKEINQALNKAKELILKNNTTPIEIIDTIKMHLSQFKEIKIQYIDIVDTINNLEQCKEISKNSLVAIAVFIGNTRLIDNFFVNDII